MIESAHVDYQTDPGRYRHWKLTFDGRVATLAMDIDEEAGLRPGYKLKLNSYDLGVDIELNDAIDRLRFEHPEVRTVVVTGGRERLFCSGANIFMLGASSHGWKVNFCKFTNETRNGLEDSSRHSGLKFLAAVNGVCAGGGYELALACDEILLVDDRLLPAEGVAAGLAPVIEPVAPPLPAAGNGTSAQRGMRFGSTTPPWSAAHPCTNLYGAKAPEPWIVATVRGNMRVTDAGQEYDTHHVVLDFGSCPFPVLEGQSIGVIPPGADDKGRPHHPRRYSIASPRNGERPGYNNVSLTIKRVLEDHRGNPVRGVASNYLCDVRVGEEVKVVGPFGTSFLMPNHPWSNIVMICTGTGSAPMRAMTEWRRRLRKAGRYEGGKLMLFFGARTRAALPYLGPLQNLPKDFIDINFAFSREKDRPKRYVQDVMRERAGDLAALIADPDTYIYVCGLRAMEDAVALALRDVVEEAGLAWATLGPALKSGGRLHPETY